ncbi:helix-turn-helix domain-containing protein [Lentzea sp. CA-135723]|uniref:helix-turn-helix domain-containing protein n=1 Tax=Lentzea sp. CA-135723 TaxID=3239950 RepID=UPI003D8FDAC2
MGSLAHWTGREAGVLRRALRLSVRAFAERLGVGVRTVTKWESLGARTTPRPFMQSILDTALSAADAEAKQRFELLLRQDGETPVRDYYRGCPKEWDYETWTDDLGRAAACLTQQDFTFAGSLVDRWLRRFSPLELDGHGLHLHARSLVLLGDLQRDQGDVHGPLSASHTYRRAHQLFRDLGVPRRTAQIELSLAVVEEMNGRLELAATRYEALSCDSRLSPRDRTRALLWVGTALSKKGANEHATRVMTEAIRRFEQLEEPEDWSVAHQKLALAHRGPVGSAKRSATSTSPSRTARTPRCSESACRQRAPTSCCPTTRPQQVAFNCSKRLPERHVGSACLISWPASKPSAAPSST